MPEITEKIKVSKISWLRRILQLAFLGLLGQWSFYGIFRCPFLVPFVSCQTCPVITCWGRISSLFWGFWIGFPVLAIIFGRAFCGWACPGGLTNQLIGKLCFIKLRVKNEIVKKLSFGVFISLIISVWILLAMDNPRTMVPIRTGEFFNSIKLSFEHAETVWLIRSYIVIAFIFGGFVLANLWCRFVCPTAGVLELIKKVSIFRFYKTPACNNCNRCLKVCEMATRPDEQNCTNCGDCLNSCPVDAIKIGRKKGE